MTWTQPIRWLQTAAAGCCNRIGWVRIDPASAIGWVRVDLDPAMYTIYRDSPDSAVFWSPVNRTIGKTALIEH